MKNLIILTFLILLIFSCEKETEIPSLEIVEIINPPEAPEIYTNNSIEPKIKIRNTGKIDISSFSIGYFIDINNTSGGYMVGPRTTYFEDIKPNEEITLTLDKWGSYPTNDSSVQDGTHMLFIDIYQINSETLYNNDDNYIHRLFVLKE